MSTWSEKRRRDFSERMKKFWAELDNRLFFTVGRTWKWKWNKIKLAEIIQVITRMTEMKAQKLTEFCYMSITKDGPSKKKVKGRVKQAKRISYFMKKYLLIYNKNWNVRKQFIRYMCNDLLNPCLVKSTEEDRDWMMWIVKIVLKRRRLTRLEAAWGSHITRCKPLRFKTVYVHYKHVSVRVNIYVI